jgi:integrase
MPDNQMPASVDIDFCSLLFCDVVPLWIEIRKLREGLKPSTHQCTRGYLRVLDKFFHDIPLRSIHPGHLREYQAARQQNRMRISDPSLPGASRDIAPWRKAAGNSLINHELAVLAQILRHARLWAPLTPFYYPLPTKSWSPRMVPTEEEERRIFEIARRHPEVALALCVATITNNTSASGCELRLLKIKHLTLTEPGPSIVYIPAEAAKNGDRPRRIPLNPAARLAFVRCLQRAYQLGAWDAEHYLFPFREKKNKYDPARPASRWWLRGNWDKFRKLVGMPGLQPHDFRHLFVTRLLEMPETNPETVQALAGHVGRKMMEYYSHIRMDAKLQAVMAINPGARRKRPQT